MSSLTGLNTAATMQGAHGNAFIDVLTSLPWELLEDSGFKAVRAWEPKPTKPQS